MKFFKLNSKSVVNVNLSDYKIDWDHKVSAPQKAVVDFLQPFWISDLVLAEFRIPGSLLRVDIVNISKMICVEVSPSSVHQNYNPWIHKDRSGFLKKLKADQQKMDWIERSGFHFIELVDSDIKNLSVELFKDKFDLEL